MNENIIIKQLQEIAARLTGDRDLQKDLLQEMFLHFIHLQTTKPGLSMASYLSSCEFHISNHLKPGSNSAAPITPSRPVHERSVNGALAPSPVVRPVEIQGEWITNDIADLILPLLSGRQQQVLFLLMKGCGVRQAARELGVTHPAVIKHRKKIARVAHELLQESAGIAVRNGTNGNGHDQAHTN